MTDMTTYLQNFSDVPTWNSEPDISKDRATRIPKSIYSAMLPTKVLMCIYIRS